MNFLKKLRKEANLTQTQLANKLEVHLRTIQNWESDKTHVPANMIPKLSELFKTDACGMMKMIYSQHCDEIKQDETQISLLKEIRDLLDGFINKPDVIAEVNQQVKFIDEYQNHIETRKSHE